MGKVKSFVEFVNETFLDNQVDPEVVGYDEKKMKKNGYIEVTIIEPDDGLEKDDKVLVSGTEIGQLDDESLVTCYKGKEKHMTTKKNLQMSI